MKILHQFALQLNFFRNLILTNFKLSLALKGAFLLTLLLTLVKQLLFLIAWKFFFVKYKTVQGWDFDLMLLMYGSVCFSIGVVEAFFYGLKDLPRMIENGNLDTFLLQPKNIILNIAMSKGDMASFGEIVTGVCVIAYSGFLLKAPLMILILLALGVIFMFSLFLYLSCIAFFITDSYDFIRELYLNSVIVSSQPNVAYRGFLKMFTFTLLPVAFLSYFPVEFFRTGVWHYLFISAFGIFVFLAIASGLFALGVRRYESGSQLGVRH